jgi:hypothetical protein
VLLVYDCSAGDPGYDFLVWLVEAEMFRRRAGRSAWPDPLKVEFRKACLLDEGGQRWLANVWRPLLPMLNCSESRDFEEEPVHRPNALSYEHLFDAIVQAATRGEVVPRFHADASARHWVLSSALHTPQPIVITLRECDYSTHRNSNLDAWLEFAQSLQDAGEQVIIVRDTAKGSEPLEGFLTFPPGSYDVRKRLALYEQAKMNFFVSNGPVMLAAFSGAPYCYLMTQYAGSQGPPRYPWAKDNQRIFYLADTAGNLAKVWEEAVRSVA